MNEHVALITYIALILTITLSGLLIIYSIRSIILQIRQYKLAMLLKKPNKNEYDMSKLSVLIEKEN